MPNPITHSLVRALRAVPDFGALDDGTLLRIVGASANLHWPAGSTVFREGEPAEAVYIVLRGQVRVFTGGDGEDVEAARIGRGDYFGEVSLLLDTTHSKSAEAVEDSELMVIPKDSFQTLLASSPDLAGHFRRKVEERIPGPHPSGDGPGGSSDG